MSQINIAFHRYRPARQSIVTLKSKSITVPFVNNSNSFIEYVWSGCGKLKARFGYILRRVINVLRVYRIEGVAFVSFSAARLYLWVLKRLLIFQGFGNVRASSYSRLKSSDEINGKIRGIVSTAQLGNLMLVLLSPSKWSSFLFLIYSYGLVLPSGSCERRYTARRCTETRKYWAVVLVPTLQNLMQVTSLWMVTS